MAIYRLGRWLQQKSRNVLWWPLLGAGWLVYVVGSCYVKHALGIRLELSSDIGPGLYIGHFGGIVVRRCRLGANCSISQSSVIAPVVDGPGPTLGDRVWIGAHARVLGSIRVGDGCAISAAAIVQRDIPEKSLCMGNPARVVLRNYDNSRILNLPD